MTAYGDETDADRQIDAVQPSLSIFSDVVDQTLIALQAVLPNRPVD